MVKSRRSASRCQSRPNATLAWRPKVSTSSRSVVTSNGRPSMTTVMVPCSMPVGTALKPAASARRITSCGSAVVAISMSPIGSPSSALRTAPPTTRASSPSRSSTASRRDKRAFVAARAHRAGRGAVRGHLFLSRHEHAILDMRRRIGRVRRRAAELREHDEAADHQQRARRSRARRCARATNAPGRARPRASPTGTSHRPRTARGRARLR